MTEIRYGKPSMTNLPSDLFESIAKEMLTSPAPNYMKMNSDCDKIRNQIISERNKTNERK